MARTASTSRRIAPPARQVGNGKSPRIAHAFDAIEAAMVKPPGDMGTPESRQRWHNARADAAATAALSVLREWVKGADNATRRRIGIDTMCAALDVIEAQTDRTESGAFFEWNDLPPKIQYVARFWLGDIIASHAEFIHDALQSNLSSDKLAAQIEAVAGKDAA